MQCSACSALVPPFTPSFLPSFLPFPSCPSASVRIIGYAYRLPRSAPTKFVDFVASLLRSLRSLSFVRWLSFAIVRSLAFVCFVASLLRSLSFVRLFRSLSFVRLFRSLSFVRLLRSLSFVRLLRSFASFVCFVRLLRSLSFVRLLRSFASFVRSCVRFLLSLPAGCRRFFVRSLL